MSWIRRLPPAAFVIGAVAVFRLSLIGRGAMAYLDETNYYKAVLALGELRSGHLGTAILHMSSNSARPGLAVVQLIPAALQGIPFAFGVSPSNPYSLLIPVTFNVFESLLALYMFWRISVLVFDGDETAATIAAGIYGLLVNSTAYVRHLLAMEPALALGLTALWLALSREKTLRLAFAIGALALATMTVYPGYYLFAAVVCVAFIGPAGDATWRSRAKLSAPVVSGAVTVLAATEMFCRIGGVSFLERMIWLARRIDNGSFEEGWTFLPSYMLQVEHFIGGVLMAGTVMYLLTFAIDVARRRPSRTIDWLVIPAIAAWIFQAVNAFHLHKMVLYGRLIHPWMAFMVWATLDAIRRIPWSAVRRAACMTAIAASAGSWVMFASEYYRLEYPLDVLYRFRINTALVPAVQRPCELWPWYVYESPAPLNRRTGAPYTTRADYVLVDFCMGPPNEAERLPEAKVSALRLVYRARHFETFAAYGFEGFTSDERAAAERRRLELRIYEPE